MPEPQYKFWASLLKNREIEKEEWQFNWQFELEAENRVVYKLTAHPPIKNGKNEIVGLISMEERTGYVYVHIIEKKLMLTEKRITPYLFTLASLWSNSLGYDSGFSFDSKTHLITYYESLGAIHVGKRHMVINHIQAERLVQQCLPHINLEYSNL